MNNIEVAIYPPNEWSSTIYTCIQSLAIIRGVKTGDTIYCYQELLICNNKKWNMTC